MRAACSGLLLLWAGYTADALAADSLETASRGSNSFDSWLGNSLLGLFGGSRSTSSDSSDSSSRANATSAAEGGATDSRGGVSDSSSLWWQHDGFPLSADLYVRLQRVCAGRGLDHLVEVNPSLDTLLIPT